MLYKNKDMNNSSKLNAMQYNTYARLTYGTYQGEL